MLTRYLDNRSAALAVGLTTLAALYVVWKITQSPSQATQFAFNGLAVGAVYALIAMGFTLVYSTVWFFDLYYGAASALGAYGVFYLRSHDTLGGRYEVNQPLLESGVRGGDGGGGAVGVSHGFRAASQGARRPEGYQDSGAGLVGAVAGVYMWLVLSYPVNIHSLVSPAVGVIGGAVGSVGSVRGLSSRVSAGGRFADSDSGRGGWESRWGRTALC